MWGVLNYRSRVMKLTQGKLRKGTEWKEWRQAEWQQLDQYEEQGMFGEPRERKQEVVLRLVWTYREKILDGRKKARCACDGSMRAGHVTIYGYTYAGCVEHTISRLFCAIAAAEGLRIYGADVTNAFGDAPPPKQGLYIWPDIAGRMKGGMGVENKKRGTQRGPCTGHVQGGKNLEF